MGLNQEPTGALLLMEGGREGEALGGACLRARPVSQGRADKRSRVGVPGRA